MDLHMHEDLHKSNEIDAIIPTCVITVVLPMTDEHWANYHQALKFFPKALELYTMLSVGKDNFDQVTAGHKDAEGNLTYPQLSLEGQTLEEMLGGMVKGRRLGIPWDWERMGNRPAMLPTEYGGQLKDYVS